MLRTKVAAYAFRIALAAVHTAVRYKSNLKSIKDFKHVVTAVNVMPLQKIYECLDRP